MIGILCCNRANNFYGLNTFLLIEIGLKKDTMIPEQGRHFFVICNEADTYLVTAKLR